MPELKLRQLEYESDTWKRLMSFMVDENIHLKNRLSEVLRYKVDKQMLEEAENFHTRFIRQDEFNHLLRNEIFEFDKLLSRKIFEDGRLKNEVAGKSKNLRNNIRNLEELFGELKFEFNNFLSVMLYGDNRTNYLNKN